MLALLLTALVKRVGVSRMRGFLVLGLHEVNSVTSSSVPTLEVLNYWPLLALVHCFILLIFSPSHTGSISGHSETRCHLSLHLLIDNMSDSLSSAGNLKLS